MTYTIMCVHCHEMIAIVKHHREAERIKAVHREVTGHEDIKILKGEQI